MNEIMTEERGQGKDDKMGLAWVGRGGDVRVGGRTRSDCINRV